MTKWMAFFCFLIFITMLAAVAASIHPMSWVLALVVIITAIIHSSIGITILFKQKIGMAILISTLIAIACMWTAGRLMLNVLFFIWM